MSLDASIVVKTIFIVTEGGEDRQTLAQLFQAQGFVTQSFTNYQDYIEQAAHLEGCLVADIAIGKQNAVQLLTQLNQIEHLSPAVFVANIGSVSTVVEAIKLGAFDFIEKPFAESEVLEKVTHAIRDFETNIEIINRYKQLTDKERQVFACIVLGATNQQMTQKLHISTSTVEKHRAAVMKKMQAETLPCLVKMLPMLNPLSIDLEPTWCDLAAS